MSLKKFLLILFYKLEMFLWLKFKSKVETVLSGDFAYSKKKNKYIWVDGGSQERLNTLSDLQHI